MAKKKSDKSIVEVIENVKETVETVVEKVKKLKEIKDDIKMDIYAAQEVLGIKLKSPGITRDKKINDIQDDIRQLTIILAKILNEKK